MGLAFKRLLGSLGGARDLTLIETILGTESANLIGYWPQSETPASQEYLTFNGTTSKIDCGSAASLDDLQDAAFTADGWIKATTGGVQNFFYKRSPGWYLRYNADGTIIGFIECATTNAITATGVIANGEWHHIAMTFDDAGDRKIYIYVDGVAVTQNRTAGVDAISSDAANNLLFGSRGNTSETLNGQMGWMRLSDNVRWSSGFTPPARTTIPAVDANTVGLWPMNEGYGSVAGDLSANGNDGTITDGDWGAYPAAVNAQGVAARNGAYTGVTLGQSVSPFTAPLYDGVNDFTNIYSASLAGAFSGAAGTAMVFAKVSAAGVWTDGLYHKFLTLWVDTTNYVQIDKQNASKIRYLYYAGGTLESVTKSSVSETGWMHLAITWDKAGSGNMIAYYNGSPEGSAQAIAGTWAGSLASSTTVIGAANTNPDNVWDGYLAHCAVWTKALTPAQILAIWQASGVA